LADTCSTLQNTIQTLNARIFDFPRLAQVIQTERCYELVAESDMASAQRQLASEIEPQIKELIERAESGLLELQKKEKNLHDKAETLAPSLPPPAKKPFSNADEAALQKRLDAVRTKKALLLKQDQKIHSDLERQRKILAGLGG